MNVLVTYDVNTETKEGRRRLSKLATACKNFGQRVQKSVFECLVTDVQMEKFRKSLTNIIDTEKDSLRIYYLIGDRENFVEVFGRDAFMDFEQPLVV
jgi:CRISPR-associated protein Cas2